MKKLALLFAVIFSTGIILTLQSFAVVLPIRVVVNGSKVVFPDAQPFIDKQGRTQTPARFIGEALGATASWDDKVKKATFEKGSKKLEIYIGKTEYLVNGQKMQMDTAALNKNSRTFVPARYVAEAFGATVRWDDPIKTVYIEINKVPVPTNSTEVVGGFLVPSETNVIVTKLKLQQEVEAAFQINLLKDDYEGQKADLKKILLQKFESDIIDAVMNHINKKKEETDELPSKVFFSKKNNQYIEIEESTFIDININVYNKGYKNF